MDIRRRRLHVFVMEILLVSYRTISRASVVRTMKMSTEMSGTTSRFATRILLISEIIPVH